MKITELKPRSNSQADLEVYIANCSSVVRDKAPKSAQKLFKRLLTESYGDTASRVLEFIPCTISKYQMDKKIQSQLFGFRSDKKYYTNARELLNWGWSLDEVLETVDFTHYKVFKCETPYFMYGQISTHNQLTTVSHSQRFGECTRGYWKPDEVKMSQAEWDEYVPSHAPLHLQSLMRDGAGIVRKEVWDRGSDMLQNRVFTIGGYMNNPNAWYHFIMQRTDKHTQLETVKFAQKLDKLLHPPEENDD